MQVLGDKERHKKTKESWEKWNIRIGCSLMIRAITQRIPSKSAGYQENTYDWRQQRWRKVPRKDFLHRLLECK
jgi:hypothetical protein